MAREEQFNLLEVKVAPNWKSSIFFVLLAILVHWLLLSIQVNWNIPSVLPPRIEVQNVSPKKLENIRKKWKERSLLLNKNPSLPKEKAAPPNAKFWSDRNTTVEKEQKARRSTVIPQAAPKENIQPDSIKRQKSAPRSQPLDRLKNLKSLGVPLHLDQKPKPNLEKLTDPPQIQDEQAADQAILDPQLPEGSENLLSTQESVYYSFYSRLYQTIGPVWQQQVRRSSRKAQVEPGDYPTEVDVVFDQMGNLLEIHQLQGSGSREFDDAVTQAWESIKQFPNPPKGLLNSKGEVHTGWTFNVQVTRGLQVQYLNPERNY